MRTLLAVVTVACAIAAQTPASATLLVNGGLDDPPVHEGNVATGWTLTEGPDSLDDTGMPVPTDTASFVTFADRSVDGRGLWLRSFMGGFGEGAPDTVFAHLVQGVPGSPGIPYQLTAWSYWEAFYPGGLATPTQTLLAIEFLDAANGVLGSAQLDLRAEQQNDATWRQHQLQAVAPAGTAFVQVRASMLDGLLQMGNPQSAFFDDFELVEVPEPASLALLLGGVACLAAGRRRPS